LIGVDLGGLINNYIPDFSIMILFLLFNCYVFPKTVKKANAERKKEN